MNDIAWFSAMLRFVIVVGDEMRAVRRARSLIMLRARDHDDAWRRALSRGHELESDYEGGTGERIRWLLERVETLDQLEFDILEGREVYSEPIEITNADPVVLPLSPESSAPGTSGV